MLHTHTQAYTHMKFMALKFFVKKGLKETPHCQVKQEKTAAMRQHAMHTCINDTYTVSGHLQIDFTHLTHKHLSTTLVYYTRKTNKWLYNKQTIMPNRLPVHKTNECVCVMQQGAYMELNSLIAGFLNGKPNATYIDSYDKMTVNGKPDPRCAHMHMCLYNHVCVQQQLQSLSQ